jgi:precorrin-6Y C5,15-methyltransferase (decarboxylating)
MESQSSQAGKAVVLGAPDEWYEHQQGMITKAEVRAVTLSKLRLETGSVLWDLGAGSGSVAIEASLWITSGRICAVEKNPERVAQIHRNCEAFGVSGVEVYQAMLPEGLEALPTPDRVFIGGGGRDLGKIIDASLARLQPGGILVVNTVLIGNVGAAIDAMTLGGLETDIVQIQVSRGHVMPFDRMLKAQNPVWIISGQNRRIQ